MSIQDHDILLCSEEQFAGRVPPHHLGYLLVELPTAIRGAVSMSLRNRSKVPGRQPEWLRRASDIRFVGHGGNGETHLRFELLTLNESAAEIYSQNLLFEGMRPDGRLTGLDLLMRVIDEVDAGKADSDCFDPQLLDRLTRFRRFFRRGPFTEFRIVGSESAGRNQVAFTPETCKRTANLYRRTPKPQRVRIVGWLDGIEASTLRFSLLLDSGERVVGVFPEDLADQLQTLWRTRVLVVGTAVYRASGNLLRVEADDIQNGENAAGLFSQLPTPSHSRLDANRLRRPQGPRSGMAAIMGRWPGDETDEEIEQALERLS
jgi:hypothetical protein